MFVIFGLVVVFGSIVLGYTMHGGQLILLYQLNEVIIIGGAGIGAILVAGSPSILVHILKQVVGVLKPSPFNTETFKELLQVLYGIFYAARKDGLVGIEKHVEEPDKSEIFSLYPSFQHNEHAVSFLSDTLKVLLTGAVEDHHLSEILDLDLDQHHHEAMVAPRLLQSVADAMPGFGIVAAVLGIIITMGKIGGSPEAVGESVGAALVGTFLGILLSYGVLSPLSQAMQTRALAEERYMHCIRTALLSFARGDPPITSVEFARRNIHPDVRPSFTELEAMTRRRS